MPKGFADGRIDLRSRPCAERRPKAGLAPRGPCSCPQRPGAQVDHSPLWKRRRLAPFGCRHRDRPLRDRHAAQFPAAVGAEELDDRPRYGERPGPLAVDPFAECVQPRQGTPGTAQAHGRFSARRKGSEDRPFKRGNGGPPPVLLLRRRPRRRRPRRRRCRSLDCSRAGCAFGYDAADRQRSHPD